MIGLGRDDEKSRTRSAAHDWWSSLHLTKLGAYMNLAFASPSERVFRITEPLLPRPTYMQEAKIEHPTGVPNEVSF